LLALGVTAPIAFAQQSATLPKTTQPPKTTAPAAGAQAPAPVVGAAAPASGAATAGGAPAGEEQSAWVKLCEKSEQTQNKQICLTNHERIDGNSGMVIVGAAVRKIEGEEKQQLLVKLPQAALLALPAGVQIKVDDGQPISLQYTFCYAMSCQAETEVTKELFESMRKGKQLMVAVVNLQGKAIGLPVPLAGFPKAYDGPPVDSAKYQESRRQVMEAIRKRQMELAAKANEAQQKKEQGQGSQKPQGSNGTTAAPKIAPAPPKPAQ
jgi:invasion protein IalB